MIALRRACTAGSRFARPLFSILLLAGTAVAGDAMATTYRIVPLTIPADAIYGDAFDINATGDVVGVIAVDNESLIVEWSPPDYAMRVLPLPDEDIVLAQAVASTTRAMSSASGSRVATTGTI